MQQKNCAFKLVSVENKDNLILSARIWTKDLEANETEARWHQGGLERVGKSFRDCYVPVIVCSHVVPTTRAFRYKKSVVPFPSVLVTQSSLNYLCIGLQDCTPAVHGLTRGFKILSPERYQLLLSTVKHVKLLNALPPSDSSSNTCPSITLQVLIISWCILEMLGRHVV